MAQRSPTKTKVARKAGGKASSGKSVKAGTKRASDKPRSVTTSARRTPQLDARVAVINAATAQAAEDEATATNLAQINEIIKNARATWFALLGALVFAAVTLASVQDVAFFVDKVQTKLPLAGISVPIRSFFWAGALLIAALYIYFHLYLEQLWQALGEAKPRVNGKPLADCIHPWLVSDTALRVRDWLREERKPGWKAAFRRLLSALKFWRYRQTHSARNLYRPPTNIRSARSRGMGKVSNIVSVLLVWIFGLAVIFWFWWRSMPAHDVLLTGWLALVLTATLLVFFKSGYGALARLRGNVKRENWKLVFPFFLVAIIGLTIVRTDIDPWVGKSREVQFTLFQCTDEQKENERIFCLENFDPVVDFLRPARANLKEVVFTVKPEGWLGLENENQNFSWHGAGIENYHAEMLSHPTSTTSRTKRKSNTSKKLGKSIGVRCLHRLPNRIYAMPTYAAPTSVAQSSKARTSLARDSKTPTSDTHALMVQIFALQAFKVQTSGPQNSTAQTSNAQIPAMGRSKAQASKARTLAVQT